MTAGAPLKPSSAVVMRPSYAGLRQPVTMFPGHRGSRPYDDKRGPGTAVPAATPALAVTMAPARHSLFHSDTG